MYHRKKKVEQDNGGRTEFELAVECKKGAWFKQTK